MPLINIPNILTLNVFGVEKAPYKYCYHKYFTFAEASDVRSGDSFMEKTSQVELFGGTELGTVEKSSSIKGTVNTGIESFFWPGTERFEKFRLSWNCTTPGQQRNDFCHI